MRSFKLLTTTSVILAAMITTIFVYSQIQVQRAEATVSPINSTLKNAEPPSAATFPEVYREFANQAVFMIKPYGPDRQLVRSGGTGFYVRHKGIGYIVTNRHICKMPTEKKMLILHQAPRVYYTRIHKISDKTDLCILDVPADFVKTHTPYDIDSETLQLNVPLAVFGHPFLRPLTASSGKFVNMSIEPAMSQIFASNKDIMIGRLDFMVQPGNSGSPVLDTRNHVVGVVFAYETIDNVGLFIPAVDLEKFIESSINQTKESK